MNAEDKETNDESQKLFVKLLKKGYETVKSLERITAQGNIAASRLIGREDLGSTTQLRSALEKTMKELQEQKELGNDFVESSSRFITTILSLVGNYERISNTNDSETRLSLYYDTAMSCIEFPELLATWINNMATKHADFQNWEEAAQCMIHLAYIQQMFIDPSEKFAVAELDLRQLGANVGSELVAKSKKVLLFFLFLSFSFKNKI